MKITALIFICSMISCDFIKSRANDNIVDEDKLTSTELSGAWWVKRGEYEEFSATDFEIIYIFKDSNLIQYHMQDTCPDTTQFHIQDDRIICKTESHYYIDSLNAMPSDSEIIFWGKAYNSRIDTLLILVPYSGPIPPLHWPKIPTVAEEMARTNAFADSLKGKIVWSKGRIEWNKHYRDINHDIWIMNADGTDKKPLTETPNNVDWFPRFSPDGSTVLFTRSRSGWEIEMDAEISEKWQIWAIEQSGVNEELLVDSAAWGTWHSNRDSILFSRGSKVFIKSLSTKQENVVFDAEEFFGKDKIYCQQPSLSPEGRFVAITLRGTMREPGIYNREKNIWHSAGSGMQITWFKGDSLVVRVNEGSGNGGTQCIKIPLDSLGKPIAEFSTISYPPELLLMDLRGSRSHEYFPEFDNGGRWMVWAATDYGHEHDIVNYEIFLWNTGANMYAGPIRLTFNEYNDRWPDIFVSN